MVTPILFFDWNTLLIYAVLCLPSGPSLSAFLVNGPEVLDIKIVPSSKPQIAGEPPSNTLHPPSSTRRTPFLASNREAPTTKENIPLTNGIPQEPQVAATDSKILQPISIEKSTIRDPDATPTATLTEPFNHLNLVSPTPTITEEARRITGTTVDTPTKGPAGKWNKGTQDKGGRSEKIYPEKPSQTQRNLIVQVSRLSNHYSRMATSFPRQHKPPSNEHPVPARDQAEHTAPAGVRPQSSRKSPL